ncbi:MAG: hypothetical protein ABIN97_04940 [Ginsengibacter sp.]
MLKFIFILSTAAIITAGCQQRKSTQPQSHRAINKNFFPVTQYLLGQLNELDSLPITPLKITNINGRIDSIWMTKKDIRPFALPFINPVIDSSLLHNFFSETSFLDQTLNAFTFSYDPVKQLPDSMEVKRWDIYVDPGNNEVKRIYIVKQLNNDISPQTIQLTWKSGFYCQITTITEKKGASPEIKEEKLIWNFSD